MKTMKCFQQWSAVGIFAFIASTGESDSLAYNGFSFVPMVVSAVVMELGVTSRSGGRWGGGEVWGGGQRPREQGQTRYVTGRFDLESSVSVKIMVMLPLFV